MPCAHCGGDIPPAARFCPNCGSPLQDGLGAEGERRHATVVFSDLSGYTALNERLDPEEVEEIMNRVKREAAAVFERHGGVVNQFVGDEVMALFGVPTARRDDPVRAVRAALELHRAVRAISAEIGARVGQEVSMHTGVNSGLVIVRRSDSREGRFMLTGDTVNTAARLLKLAREDEIVVGQDTWREIAPAFDGEAGPPTEVKGKEKPVVPWRIRAERATPAAQARPLLGRAAEIARFDRIAQAGLGAGRGGTIVVRGDPGIGKTRLAAEFLARGAALGFETHRALVLDFSAERGSDAVRTIAREFARGRAPEAMAPEREIFLCELLDTALRPELQALAAAMDPAMRDRGTIEALRDLAIAAAARRPRLVLVEDVHWADAWTLDRLAALATLAAALPLVLAVTTRRENDPSAKLTAAATADTLDLEPLGIDEARALAAQFPEVSADAAQRYIERADGNPLFLEQLLLNSAEGAAHNLPGSIQSLVLARMDRLHGTDRGALQAASVLGQRFSLDALRYLMDDPRLDCRGLLENFLVRAEGAGYLFWHALVRDGAYESLLRSRRRQLHARAAEWFLARDKPMAAEHFDRAVDPRAARTYLEASDEEASRYRYERALALADRGLALATEPGERFLLAGARGRILLDSGRARESVAAWQDAAALAGAEGERCRALIGVAAGLRIIDRTAEGLAALDEAEPLARAAGLDLELSRLHHLRGNLVFGLGRADECLREHEAALAFAVAAGSSEAEANALGGLGDAHYIRGRMRSAYEEFGRCVALARRHGYGRIEMANLPMAGWTAHALNRLEEALEIGTRCLEMALAVSNRRVELVARGLVIYVAGWLMGRVDDAQRHLDLAIPATQAIGAKRFEGQARTYLAQIALRRGDRAGAARLAREALAFCRANGMEFFGPVALGLAARLSDDDGERAGCHAEALALLDAGAISHNHFEYYALALDDALERASWEELARYRDRLRRYTAAEPLPLCDFLIARAEVLEEAGRGGGEAALAARLRELRGQAAAARLDVYVPALEAALARLEST